MKSGKSAGTERLIQTTVSLNVASKIKRLAKEDGRSVASWVRWVLVQAIGRKGRNK